MATLRNRFFVEGIMLGGLCGIVLGSLIAFQASPQRVSAVRRFMDQVVHRDEPLRREFIRQ